MTPATPIYIPLMNDIDSIRNGAMIAITDLFAAGRGDLTAPFARVLEALAGVDYKAIQDIDSTRSS